MPCNDLPYKGLIRKRLPDSSWHQCRNDLPYKGLIRGFPLGISIAFTRNDLPYKGLIRIRESYDRSGC